MEPGTPSVHDTRPIRALVVDDDADARRLIAGFLQRSGYEVLTAGNGEEAMKIVRAEGPPIVITDWLMPVMDGVQLCRAIRQHAEIPFIFVIIMTVKERSEEHVWKALEAGADDFIHKPVSERELMARLRCGNRFLGLQEDLDRRTRDVHRTNAEMVIAYEKLGRANEQLRRIATTDELTGLTNRRAAMEMLDEQWAAAKRHGWPLSVILFDIDHFKRFNDAYGHAVGDAVLRDTAEILRRNARREERCCRIGGEEFLILCPNTTAEKAAIGAERIRRAIAGQIIEHGGLRLNVTVSLGVAHLTPSMSGADDLLNAADRAMYAAKAAGRNQVICADESPNSTPPAGSIASFRKTVPVALRFSPNASHVLVVDDDSPAREQIRDVLRQQGYTVSEATDGSEAVAQAAKLHPDVVLMTMRLPTMSGLEAAQRLKANPLTRDIPLILQSVRADVQDVRQALEAGADEFLAKPADPHELALRVRTMIRLRHELNFSNAMRGEQSRVLALLLDFSNRIASAESLPALLTNTTSALRELTCCRRVHVVLPDESGNLIAAPDAEEEDGGIASAAEQLNGDIALDVFRTGETVTQSGDASQDADHTVAALPVIPFICSPLQSSEQRVGVAWIADRQRTTPFTALEIEYVELIGNIAASAIHDFLTRRARDDARDSIVIALAKLAESRDRATGRHLDRVTRYCVTLARQLRANSRYLNVITDAFLRNLERAVPLHDIGKVAVPDHILNKPETLLPEEMELMRGHAAVGAATIRSVMERAPGADFLVMAEEIAHSHHEWFNGQGYPRRLAGPEIPLSARIAALADVYDALTTRRVYKDAMTHDRAARIIRAGRGLQFDPDIVDAFEGCADEFYALAVELADDCLPKPLAATCPA